MITFLPYSDFKSVDLLDNRRLFKQVVEAKQMINSMELNDNIRIKHHPATLAWSKNIDALKLYYNTVLDIAKNRGFNTDMKYYNIENAEMPWWLGHPCYHRSMRSRLFSKNPEFYSDFIHDKNYNQGQYWYPLVDEYNFYRHDTKLLLYKDYILDGDGIYEDQYKFSTVELRYLGSEDNKSRFLRLDKNIEFLAEKVNGIYLREDGVRFKIINKNFKYKK